MPKKQAPNKETEDLPDFEAFEKLRMGLQQKISRANTVCSELKSSGAWRIITEDLSNERKRIDDNWHLIQDEAKLLELRITKMAISHLANTLLNYENDKRMAESELVKLEHPEDAVPLDYDTE